MKLRVLAALVVVALAYFALRGGEGVRVATFNIRMYPESERQEAGAFEAIRQLGAAAVAVQEITEPQRFAKAARERLGESWRFVWPAASPAQRVGVLYDDAKWTLLSTTTHRDTLVYDGAKPAFEVRLRDREGGDELVLVVVHLKAGGDGLEIRRRQLDGLRTVVERLTDTADHVVVLGDFNSTGPQDREAIDALAEATDVEWASEDLDCTSYWTPETACVGAALDHVLASDSTDDVTARGPCESEGCAPGDRCPTFFSEVSDHCPLTVDLGD